MKLLFENWRLYLKEQTQASSFGATVKFEKDYTISLALINLDIITGGLFPEPPSPPLSIDEFMAKLKDKDLFNKATVGYIHASYNPMLAKAGISGGNCSGTYSVTKSIGYGHGAQLYNALLGFAATKGLYITSDRNSVTTAAQRRWADIDAHTDDEVPSSVKPYKGTFDNDKETEPVDDDCKIRYPNIPALNKGYKNEKMVAIYIELRDNINRFFEDDIQPMFDEPNFFGKLFGQTPENKVAKLKNQLLKFGRNKFHDWELEALNNPKLR